MKQQRLLGIDEILIETETGGCRDLRYERRKTINALGDFVDLRVHLIRHDLRSRNRPAGIGSRLPPSGSQGVVRANSLRRAALLHLP